MAEIVLGIGTSHTPMLTLPAEMWSSYATRDAGNPELAFPPHGVVMSYDDALKAVPEDVPARYHGSEPLRPVPHRISDGARRRRGPHAGGQAVVRRARGATLSHAERRARLRPRDAAARAGAAARVLVHRQTALRQRARPDPAGVPEHVFPAEPADATPVLRRRREDRGGG